MKSFRQRLMSLGGNEEFLQAIGAIEKLVAKVLSLAMLVVIVIGVWDLCHTLISQLFTKPYGFLNTALIEIFGLFLNILIALEVLENITAYLQKHVVQLELVVITSLTAVARKIIIFDSKKEGGDIGGLALAVLALAISYWIVRRINATSNKE